MAFKKKEERKEIEIVTLLDMIFLLLVFFLVSTSLAPNVAFVQELLKISIPKSLATPNEDMIQTNKKDAHLVIQAFLDRGKERFYLLHKCLTPEKAALLGAVNYPVLDSEIWPEVPWVVKGSFDEPTFKYYRGAASEIGQPVNYAVVRKRVIALKRLLKDPRIIIRADKDLSYESIATLLGLCNQQEITKICLTVGSAGTLDKFVKN